VLCQDGATVNRFNGFDGVGRVGAGKSQKGLWVKQTILSAPDLAASAAENRKCALSPGSNPWATLENPSLQFSYQVIKSSSPALPMTQQFSF
jgi:hypothetical protein